MTDNEQARIAVLETEVRHLRDDVERMSSRQDEMYNLMQQGMGGWRAIAILAGVSGLVGGILVKIAPYLLHLPK